MLEMQSMKSISSNKIRKTVVKILLFLMVFGAAQKIILNKRKLLKIFKNLTLDLMEVWVMLFFCSNNCIEILQTSYI